MNGLDKATLIAIATTHSIEAVRRSAARSLFSLGCLTGAMDATYAMQKVRAQEFAANKVASDAIAKAQSGAS